MFSMFVLEVIFNLKTLKQHTFTPPQKKCDLKLIIFNEPLNEMASSSSVSFVSQGFSCLVIKYSAALFHFQLNSFSRGRTTFNEKTRDCDVNATLHFIFNARFSRLIYE